MPKREGPDSMEPGSLAWRRMQAQKFVWQDGDVVIMPASEKTPEQESPHPHEGGDRPGSGCG